MGFTLRFINNIRTDNRVDNLQIITARLNSSKDNKGGTSKYTGVCWDKRLGKWSSRINFNDSTIYLGVFDSEKEASIYYQNALECIINNRPDDINIKKPKFTSKYKGVYFHSKYNKWISRTYESGKMKYIGGFNTEYEAYMAIKNI